MRRSYRTTPPGSPPISIDEVKAQLRIEPDDNSENALLTSLIAAATEWLDGSGRDRDGVLGLAMVNQTWRLETQGPDHCGRVFIDHGPVKDQAAITSVEVMLNGAYAPWLADWRLAFDRDRPCIVAKPGKAWPARDCREDALRVTYVAGFGDAAAVPAPLKQALQLLIADWHTNRVPAADADYQPPAAVWRLIKPFRPINL